MTRGGGEGEGGDSSARGKKLFEGGDVRGSFPAAAINIAIYVAAVGRGLKF